MLVDAVLLTDTLENHKRFTDTKISMLDAIYMESRNGELMMQSANYKNVLTSRIECDGEIRTCVKFTKLKDLVAGVSGMIKITANDEKMSVTCGKQKSNLTCYYPENFPLRTYSLNEKITTIPSQIILDSYKRLHSCIDEKEIPTAFNFVNINVLKNKIVITATDGLQIAKCEFPHESESEVEIKIHKEDFFHLFTLAGEAESITLHKDKNHIVYKIANLLFVGYETNKNFPAFQPVYDAMKKCVPLTLPKLNLNKHLLFIDDKSFDLKLELHKNQLITFSRGIDGEYSDSYEIDYSGEDINILLNLFYLKNFTDSIKSSEFLLYFDPTNLTKIMLEEPGFPFKKIFGLRKNS